MGPPGGGGGSRSPVSMPGGRSAHIPEISSEHFHKQFAVVAARWRDSVTKLACEKS